MSRRWIYILLGILVAGLSYYLFTLLFERYEREIKTGYSQEARKNPFLAAKLFFEQKGVKASTDVTKLKFSELGNNDVVIISNVDAMLITDKQINNALNWIEGGGTLIVEIKKKLEGGDSISRKFDLKTVAVESLSDDFEDVLENVSSEETTSERLRRINENIKKQRQEKDDQTEAEQSESESEEELSKTFNDFININTFFVDTGDDQIEIEVSRRIAFSHSLIDYTRTNGFVDANNSKEYSNIKWDGDKSGARLVEFKYGSGKFIASVDLSIWLNRNIGDADHAYLLSHLTRDKSAVRIYYDFLSVPLWKLLKQHYLPTLIAFAVFIGAWLWFYALRVQPLKQFSSTERRDFNEHLQAGASFLAERQQTTKLLKPLEEDIQQQMNRFHPGFKKLSKSNQAKALIDQTQLSSKLINRWLQYCNHQLSENQLQQALKIGQTIRKKL